MPLFAFTQSLKKADNEYAVLHYSSAIDNYTKYLSKSKKDKSSDENNDTYKKVITNLADAYYSIQDYGKSCDFYGKLYDLEGNNLSEDLFIRLISTLRSIKNYRKADQLFDSYYKTAPNKIKTRDFQKKKVNKLNSEYIRVDNLKGNSKYSDFSVAVNKNKVIFSSNREDGKYLKLYAGTRNKNTGQISGISKYLPSVNSEFNDATFSFNDENHLVFFSRNYLTKKGKLDAKNGGVSHVMIMVGKMSGNKITDVKPMTLNKPNYNCSHPFITKDGKQMYFSSDMPGGFGGSDIYVVDVYNDGSCGTPKNLGPQINTPGSEMYPSVYGDSLFFSSDFYYGYGGLDVFVSEINKNSNYSIPVNLGKPINSNEDDFAFLRLPNRTGYFSSNREGGKGSDDIYWFKMKEIIKNINYSGLVLTTKSDKPIPNAEIKVLNPYDSLIKEFKSDPNGNFKMTLPTNSHFKILFSKKDYSKQQVDLYTPKEAKDSSGNKVYLTAFSSLVNKNKAGVEKINVNPIYFAYDKWDITPKAETELNKVLYAMKTFPNIKIKIESHTDSRGSDSYNLKLSDERAKSTRKYLIAQGIATSRIISAIGYGETQPLNKCVNGVHCTDEEYAVNRRSDFIIVDK